MKIAVVCANGKAGQLIVKEAVKRGFDVTAVIKGENKSAAEKAIVKDLFDLTADDVKGFGVVVDAFGAWTPDTLPQHSTSLMHLCDILSGSDIRLLVVGGAGSLYINAEHIPKYSNRLRQLKEKLLKNSAKEMMSNGHLSVRQEIFRLTASVQANISLQVKNLLSIPRVKALSAMRIMLLQWSMRLKKETTFSRE